MRRVEPSTIAGEVRAPASKSMTQRAMAAAYLACGESEILNPSWSDDARAAMAVAEALGADVEASPQRVRVVGGGSPRATVLDCGESGLCLRLFSAVAALRGERFTLEGGQSLSQRPVDLVEAPLTALGVACETQGGRPPVVVQGPLRGGRITVDASVSSQLLSGLLMALPCCEEDSELQVARLKSAPYVRMTLELLEAFGVRVDASAALDRFAIRGRQRYRPVRYTIEGDYSGAAFLLVAAALAGGARVTGLRRRSAQADRAVVEVLQRAGARVEVEAEAVSVERGALVAFEVDLTDAPDLFPPLAALACHCQGTTRLAGAGRLRVKESDRAAALVDVLGRMGAHLQVEGDRMEITGGPLRHAMVRPHRDHRIAMAAAVAALASRHPVLIADEGCVAKSYPGFFEDLQALGAAVS